MKSIFLGCLLFVSTAAFGADWEKSKDKDGITVYLKEFPGAAGAKAFKAVATIKAPFQTVVETIGNPEKMRGVLHLVEKSVVTTPAQDDYSLYLIVDMPWPVQNRDLVWSIKKQSMSGESANFSCGLSNDQMAADPQYIRFKSLEGAFLVEKVSETETLVTWNQYQDLAGSIPVMILNSAAVDVGYYSMNNLRKLFPETSAVSH